MNDASLKINDELVELRYPIITQGEESPLEYTIVNRGELQKDSRLSAWFDRNHRNRGAHSIMIDDDTYVLVSAGPKPTGGYGLKLESIALQSPDTLLVSVNLTMPKPGEMVTMAFTYPNILLRFPSQVFEAVELTLIEPDQTGWRTITE